MEQQQQKRPLSGAAHTIDLGKAAAVAYVRGEIPALHANLSETGWETTVAELEEIGRDYAALFDLTNAARKRCYFCGESCTPGGVCECLQGAVPRRHFNYNDAALLGLQSDDRVAHSFLCVECGLKAHTCAGEVKRIIAKTGRFKPRQRCETCFEEARAARPRDQKRRKTNAAALQVAAEAAAPAPGQA